MHRKLVEDCLKQAREHGRTGNTGQAVYHASEAICYALENVVAELESLRLDVASLKSKLPNA